MLEKALFFLCGGVAGFGFAIALMLTELHKRGLWKDGYFVEVSEKPQQGGP